MTLFAAELLKEIKGFVEDNVSPQVIIKGYRKACELVIFFLKKKTDSLGFKQGQGNGRGD